MSSFFSFLLNKKFPNIETREQLLSGKLTPFKGLVYILFAAILIISFNILINLNEKILVTVPARGGMIKEGLIGAPRFINPVLAATETDVSLTKLVYAGLLKELNDGSVVAELASHYDISPDGRVYTFYLRPEAKFHDGSAVTSTDVAFTIEKMQDPDLNERNSIFWQNVAVETPDSKTIVLSLLSPDTEFLKKMTLGILPTVRWQGVIDDAFVDPALNLSPIGAGPYKFSSLSYDDIGTPHVIVLERNKHYVLGAPYLDNYSVVTYANQEELRDAFQKGEIDLTFVLNPFELKDKKFSDSLKINPIATSVRVEIKRRNNEPVFQNPAFLSALNHFIDKNRIIDKVENGYGILESTEARMSQDDTISALSRLGYNIKDGLLLKGTTPVKFSIATENEPELIAVNTEIAEQLKALGIEVTNEIYNQGNFQDGLDHAIFGIVLVKTDMPISEKYASGISLYTKPILVAADKNVHGFSSVAVTSSSSRYTDAHKWFTKTDRVWKWFAKKND